MSKRLIGAAILAASIPTAAHADDPRDPSMRSAEAHARDSERTRQLNLQAAAANRGPRYHVVRPGGYEDADYAAASRAHDRDMDRYARSRAQYEHEMAEWRRAVAACRAGYYDACDN